MLFEERCNNNGAAFCGPCDYCAHARGWASRATSRCTVGLQRLWVLGWIFFNGTHGVRTKGEPVLPCTPYWLCDACRRPIILLAIRSSYRAQRRCLAACVEKGFDGLVFMAISSSIKIGPHSCFGVETRELSDVDTYVNHCAAYSPWRCVLCTTTTPITTPTTLPPTPSTKHPTQPLYIALGEPEQTSQELSVEHNFNPNAFAE